MTSEELRFLLSKHNITQKELAALMGYTQKHINKLATGKYDISDKTATMIRMVLKERND